MLLEGHAFFAVGACRVGWLEEEVIDWLRERIARRDET
jgi:predicted DNA-binding transcriptional regulator AlpA